MPLLVDHVLMVLIVIGLALRGWFGMRRLRAIPPESLPAMRPRFWARAILTQWALALVVIAWWLIERRPLAWLSLVPHLGWGFVGVMMGVVVMSFALVAQRRAISSSPDLQARLRKRLANVAALLPARREEWPGFASLAITAGICEELFFRGFVWWWLQHYSWSLLHYVPALWVVVVIQGVLFGLAHAYQGPRGVLSTGAVGLFMGGVVVVSGSLWAAMILHALIDLQAGDVSVIVNEAGRPAPGAPA